MVIPRCAKLVGIAVLVAAMLAGCTSGASPEPTAISPTPGSSSPTSPDAATPGSASETAPAKREACETTWPEAWRRALAKRPLPFPARFTRHIFSDGRLLRDRDDGQYKNWSLVIRGQDSTERVLHSVKYPESYGNTTLGPGHLAFMVRHGLLPTSSWTWWVLDLSTGEVIKVADAETDKEGLTQDPGMWSNAVVGEDGMWWQRLVKEDYVLSYFDFKTRKITDLSRDAGVGLVRWNGRVLSRMRGKPEDPVDVLDASSPAAAAPKEPAFAALSHPRFVSSNGTWLVGNWEESLVWANAETGKTGEWHVVLPGRSEGSSLMVGDVGLSNDFALLDDNGLEPILLDLTTGGMARFSPDGDMLNATIDNGWLHVGAYSRAPGKKSTMIDLSTMPRLPGCAS